MRKKPPPAAAKGEPTTGYSALDYDRRVEVAPAPDAFVITTCGSSSGAHFTDRLLLDGTQEGFYHDDFRPGFAPRYRTEMRAEEWFEIFLALESPAMAEVPEQISGIMEDGFVLLVTIRLRAQQRRIWMANAAHPFLSPLVARVWRNRPPSFPRELPPCAIWAPQP